MEDQTKFGDPTAYNIMFGPDKCGGNRRTHLIFNYKDKNVLKTDDIRYTQDNYGETQLYTLKLTPENEVTVWHGEDQLYKGELEKGWKLLEPAEIPDPDDTKPSDWVDEPMMDDPEDKKPEDWEQPEEIVDEEAKQPEDWDADEDGDWEAPMKANPDFKGEWKAKKIANPDYKGAWVQKKTANPDYVEDKELYAYDDFSFVGIDVWQVKSGAIFDKLLITDEEEEMKAGQKAWKELREAEKKMKKEEEEKQAAEKKDEPEEEKKDDGDSPDVDADDDDADDDKDDEDL